MTQQAVRTLDDQQTEASFCVVMPMKVRQICRNSSLENPYVDHKKWH